MLQTFSNHPESQNLYLRDRDLLALPINQHARQLQNLGQPAPILFLLYLDLECSRSAAGAGIASPAPLLPAAHWMI